MVIAMSVELIDSLNHGDPDKMFTYLRGFFKGAQMRQSIASLGFAREKHEGYTRKGNGQPYIIHPLSMACYAVGIGIRDDKIIAAMLLHDVPEDTKTPLSELPVDDEVRLIVDCMTIQPYQNESKWQCKERYFNNLLRHPGAVICKGADRFDNLSTMEGEMPIDSIEKNVVETKNLLLPIMRKAKNHWPDMYDYINTYRHNIKVLCRALNNAHKVDEREDEIIAELKNTPAIKDPSHAVKQSQ
jgi:GTP pyrophosphokinase